MADDDARAERNHRLVQALFGTMDSFNPRQGEAVGQGEIAERQIQPQTSTLQPHAAMQIAAAPRAYAAAQTITAPSPVVAKAKDSVTGPLKKVTKQPKVKIAKEPAQAPLAKPKVAPTANPEEESSDDDDEAASEQKSLEIDDLIAVVITDLVEYVDDEQGAVTHVRDVIGKNSGLAEPLSKFLAKMQKVNTEIIRSLAPNGGFELGEKQYCQPLSRLGEAFEKLRPKGDEDGPNTCGQEKSWRQAESRQLDMLNKRMDKNWINLIGRKSATRYTPEEYGWAYSNARHTTREVIELQMMLNEQLVSGAKKTKWAAKMTQFQKKVDDFRTQRRLILQYVDKGPQALDLAMQVENSKFEGPLLQRKHNRSVVKATKRKAKTANKVEKRIKDSRRGGRRPGERRRFARRGGPVRPLSSRRQGGHLSRIYRALGLHESCN